MLSRLRFMFAIICLCVLSAAVRGAAETAPKEPASAEEPTQRPMRGYVCGPYKVVAADFTGDGIADLAVGYNRGDVVTVERGDGKGNFSRLSIFQIPYDDRTTIEPVVNLAAGDIDGDGLLDLGIAVGGIGPPPELRKAGVPVERLRKYWRGRLVLARNLGRGRFERMVEFGMESMAQGVAPADLDKDGRLDLMYTARGSGRPGDTKIGKLYVRQGLGEWKFGAAQEYPAGPSAYYVETGDLNNDGFLDLMVPNEHGDTVQVYMNPGKELFRGGQLSRRVVRPSPIPGRRSHAVNNVRAADFNGDGNLDMVTANLGTNTISVFPGNGDGTFQRDRLYDGGGGYCAFIDVGDLDNDA